MIKHAGPLLPLIAFAGLAALSGCSDQAPERKPLQIPQEKALAFAQTGDYQLLSEKDKEAVRQAEFYWELVTDPMLEPTNKYYELEKHLLSFVSYRVGSITNEPNQTLVEIITTLPEVIDDELLFHARLEGGAHIRRANKLLRHHYQRGIGHEDLAFIERKYVYVVLPDGVYVDSGSRLELQQLTKEVSRFDPAAVSGLSGRILGHLTLSEDVLLVLDGNMENPE